MCRGVQHVAKLVTRVSIARPSGASAACVGVICAWLLGHGNTRTSLYNHMRCFFLRRARSVLRGDCTSISSAPEEASYKVIIRFDCNKVPRWPAMPMNAVRKLQSLARQNVGRVEHMTTTRVRSQLIAGCT